MADFQFRSSFFAVLVGVLGATCALSQDAIGLKAEYLKEFNGTADNLLQLAKAMPADKYNWRPGAGVRSVSEVYIHVATGNFFLLSLTGVALPSEYYGEMKLGANGQPDIKDLIARTAQLQKTLTDKDKIIEMLKRSLDSVRDHFAQASAADLDKPANFFGSKTTARGIYIHILGHVSEHYGQSIAYARMNGVVPPWSQKSSQ
jgi:uncharacterized damage-inducible protein DinB